MPLHHEGLTKNIIGAAIEVHRHLGPGLLESAYRRCLAHELRLREIAVECEVALDLEYKGLRIPASYRVDLMVVRQVVVEVKSVQRLLPVHKAQLLTYLRLSQKKVGLLMNFNVPLLREGLERLVL